MSISPIQYLWFHGDVSSPASYPEYTRLVEPATGNAAFVEFLTTSARTGEDAPLAEPTPIGTADIYVSVNTPLYFSDFPVPAPFSGVVGGNVALHLEPPKPIPAGMVGRDDTAVTETHLDGKALGPVNGLTGTAMDKTNYKLYLEVVPYQANGRVAGQKANWIVSRAICTRDTDPALTLGVAFCPSNLIATLFVEYGEVKSNLHLDLKDLVVGAAKTVIGSALLTRTIVYHGAVFSTQSLEMQATDTVPGMFLATSPVARFADAIEYFSPALAVVTGQLVLPPLTQATPLAALGAIAPTLAVTQDQYVSESTALAAGALAPLLGALAQSIVPGMADTASWVGWMLAGGLGKDTFGTVLGQAYADNKQWAYLNDENQPYTGSGVGWKGDEDTSPNTDSDDSGDIVPKA